MQPDDYYFSLLLLFKPWRNVEELKCGMGNHFDAFAKCKDDLEEAMKYHDMLGELRKIREEFEKELAKVFEENDANENSPDDAKDNILGFEVPLQEEFNNLDNLALNENVMPIADEIAQLNTDQKRIFDEVVDAVEEYCKVWEAECAKKSLENPRLKPSHVLRKFVTGVGGTGKSFLINLIRKYISKELGKQVVVAGPTGIAARNVNGLTIHRLLNLPVEHGGIPKYEPLNNYQLEILRENLKKVALLIIDEISMVSNITLTYIHMRLCEVFDTCDADDGWFGRINILVLGDLLQLDPVNEPPPYIDISKAQLKKYFTGLHIVNLWKQLFSYDELTQNVRQQSDQQFAKTLGHIRLGIMDDVDYQLLSKRVIKLNNDTVENCLAGLVQFIKKLPPSTVCLFPTRDQCRKLNEGMLNQLNGQSYALIAVDEIEAKTDKQKECAKKSLQSFKKDGKCSKTAGLEDRIEIKVGTKIMLLRNLNVAHGLVNGAIGTIKKVHETIGHSNGKQRKSVEKLTVTFDNGEFELEPVRSKFPLNQCAFITRKQFPVCLAYTITVHKSQGLTLDSCLVEIGGTTFAYGQTYVALSRLKSLSGLHIVNFNPASIKTNGKAIIEYNRLRETFRKDLPQIPTHISNKRNIPDRNKYSRKQAALSIEPSIVNNNNVNGSKRTSNNDLVVHGIRGMQNNNNACYANSAFQCLANIDCIKDCLLKKGPRTTLKSAFLNYFNPLLLGTNLDITDMRLEYFDDFEQQDSGEFLRLLLNADSSKVVKDLCQHDLVISIRCSNSNCNVVRDPLIIDNLVCSLHIPVERKCNMTDLINVNLGNWQETKESHCDGCGASLQSQTTVQNSRRVLIFSLLIADDFYIKVTNLNLSNVPQTVISLGNKKYVLSGAVFHHGSELKQGHYTAVIRKNGKFYRTNDGIISECTWPRNTKDVYLLFDVEK